MDEEKLIQEQTEELFEILNDSDFTEIIHAQRVTPPDKHQPTGVFEKHRLKPENLIKLFPAERIVHHRDGDVTFITKNRGVLRFVNTGAYHRKAFEVMAVMHE